MQADESALIVPVPRTEAAVGPWRTTLDRAAGWGVPAHITVLYPFVPPRLIAADVLADVAAAVASVPSFEVAFHQVRWFGDHVVWLAPEPDSPFRQLTAAVWQRFPHHAPYEGAHDDIVPHLTIGHDHPQDVLSRAADAVSAQLPIHAAIRGVRLIAGSHQADSWRTLCEFPLG